MGHSTWGRKRTRCASMHSNLKNKKVDIQIPWNGITPVLILGTCITQTDTRNAVSNSFPVLLKTKMKIVKITTMKTTAMKAPTISMPPTHASYISIKLLLITIRTTNLMALLLSLLHQQARRVMKKKVAIDSIWNVVNELDGTSSTKEYEYAVFG